MLTAHDRRLAARAAGIAAIASALALVIVATTDEGASWARRLGMVAALAPVAGAIGSAAAIRLACGRGELRALAAIGVDPLRAVLGAVLGGVAPAAIGPALAAVGLADLGGLFPRGGAGRVWVVEGDTLRELSSGLAFGPGGVVDFGVPQASPAAVALSASVLPFTVAALAIAAVACPLWIAAPAASSADRSVAWTLTRAVVVTVSLLGAVVAFQAVAAGRLAPAALVLAPVALLVDALISAAAARYRAPHRR